MTQPTNSKPFLPKKSFTNPKEGLSMQEKRQKAMDELGEICSKFIGCGLKDETYFLHRLFEQHPEFTAKFAEWFDNNMIYSENVNSFVMRIVEVVKANPDENKCFFQNKAFDLIDNMRAEFLYTTYKLDDIRNMVEQIKIDYPRPNYQQLVERAKVLQEKIGDTNGK